MQTRRRIGCLTTKQIKELCTHTNPLRHWSWKVYSVERFKFITVDIHVRMPYTWKNNYSSYNEHTEARYLPWNKKPKRKK